jgi:hypothetical protein
MKEHAIFIEGSMPPPAKQIANQANRFKQQFDRLLLSVITTANGFISREALLSGQYYTQ